MKCKTLFLALIFFTVSCPLSNICYAETLISSVTRLNLSRGKIAGEKVDFELSLSLPWMNYLIADREKTYPDTGILEKINFYYEPQDKKSKQAYLMSFLVLEPATWNSENLYVKIFETENYIFAINNASQNNFTSKIDYNMFNNFIHEASDMNFILKMLKFEKVDCLIGERNIIVDGLTLNNKSHIDSNGELFLPVREISEELGYKIDWFSEKNTVIISNNDFNYLLLPETSFLNDSFKTKNINGILYAPALFFTQVLNSSLEFGEESNIYIKI